MTRWMDDADAEEKEKEMKETEAERPRNPGAADPRRPESKARAPYVQPRLERLGGWSALTLQQSVPIFP